MQSSGSTYKHNIGFTLLEVMLVLLLMGLAAGYVMFNAFGASKSDLLKSQAQRLQVIVDMASDFAVLNQQQLGVRFEADKNEYYFVYLDDDDQWQRIEGEKTYEPYTLPEPFTFTLNLDDLPWDVEDRLFDRELFDENLSVSDEGVEIGNEEEKKLAGEDTVLPNGTGMQLKHVKETGPQVKQQNNNLTNHMTYAEHRRDNG